MHRDPVPDLRSAYDAIAAVIVFSGSPDDVTEVMIPSTVYEFHVQRDWARLHRKIVDKVLAGSITKWKGKQLQMVVRGSEHDAPNAPPAVPLLTHDDPRNRLSIESRKRLYRVQAKAEAGIWKAKAEVHQRFGTESHPRASSLLTSALAKAANTNMAAASKEYGALGLSEKDFREIMRGEIEAITNSFEMNQAYRQMLEAEFLYPPEMRPLPVRTPKPTTIATPDIAALKRPRQSGTVTNLVAARRAETYMQENGLTQPKFAKRAGTTDRTLRSFFKTGKIRKSLIDGIAKAMRIDTESLLSSSSGDRKITGR